VLGFFFVLELILFGKKNRTKFKPVRTKVVIYKSLFQALRIKMLCQTETQETLESIVSRHSTPRVWLRSVAHTRYFQIWKILKVLCRDTARRACG
jgi:hypothetical protein